MLPTLLESSTSPRGLLMPSLRLRLMPTTPMPMELTVLAMAMVDTPMVPTPTPMDTTARGPLRPSLRLRLMPTTLDMVDSMVDMDMPVLAMVDMPTMPLTDMVSPMLDTAMPVLPMVMVPTPTPMVP